jgi:peptidoglycan hydrolase-like protein with peptidoglycan-binding domain
MKKLVLALIASAAVASPAFAQSGNGQANLSTSRAVSAQSLSRQQIRRIQMTLNRKGYSAGHVDGRWGPTTRRALIDFQKEQHINSRGRLTHRTLADLGVANAVASNQQPNTNMTEGRSAATGHNARNANPRGTHFQSTNSSTNPSAQNGANGNGGSNTSGATGTAK